jgi:hypothetical protein
MSSRRCRAREPDFEDVEAVVEVLAELAVRERALEVAVGRGDDADVAFIGRVPPSRWNSRSCRTRSSFACTVGVISATSSRNSTPPAACSSRPGRAVTAPVNAPFSWPNSSDSRSVSGGARS